MRPKKATPEEGARIDREHFCLFTPKPGTAGTTSGWCACEPWWGICHDYHDEHGPTKVCLHWFTDGELHCPRCRRQPATERMAYCLWWRADDLAPLFTICRNSTAPFLEKLKYGDPIFVGRVDRYASPFLKFSEGCARFKPDHPLRRREVEILPLLLEVWRLPQLDDWVRQKEKEERRGGEITPQPEAQTLSVPPPTTRTEALALDAHRRFGHLETIGDLADAVNEAARRKKASKNGKHEKKEGE